MGFTIYYLPLTSFDECFLRSCVLFSTIDLNSFPQISSEIPHFIKNYYFLLKSLVAYVLPLRSEQYQVFTVCHFKCDTICSQPKLN